MFFYNESDSEVSIVQPTVSDPYFYNTSLLLKMDNDFSDSSIYGSEIVPYGNVSQSTTESKYGGGSAYFNGNGNILAIMQGGQHFNFGADNFTIEFWHKPTSNNARQWFFHADADYWIGIDKDVSGRYGMWASSTGTSWDIVESDSGQGRTINSALLNQWNHIAFVRSGNSFMIFLNGNLEKTVSGSGAIFDRSSEVKRIGEHSTPSFLPIEGYIDDFRITKGVARYTANFTPPDSHPTTGPSEIVSTDLQLHLDAGDTNSYPGTGTTWFDLSGNGNDGSFVGTPSFGGSAIDSIYFNSGPDTYIQTPYNSSVSNISLSVWFKAQVQDSDPNSWLRPILCLGDIGASSPPLIIQIFSPNSPYDGQLLDSVSTRYDDYQWHNAVVTWNGTQERYYVDGNLIFETTRSSYDVSIPLRIGGGSSMTARRFLGRVAQVLVHEKSLSDAEVLQNFEVTKSRFGL